MKISRKEVNLMFAALGYPTAEKWTVDKMDAKLSSLKSIVSKLSEEDKPEEGSEEEKVLAMLLEAVDAGEDITVSEDNVKNGDEEKKAGKKKSAGKDKSKKSAKAETKSAKKSAKKKEPKERKPRGPGVLQAIADILCEATEKKPIDKEGILDKLVKKFPDREPDSMKVTINSQIPNRVAKERNLKVTRVEGKGYYAVAK